MNIVLLQTKLPLEEIEQLLAEFPQFLFLSFTEMTYQGLSLDNWAQVEIIYGCKVTEEDLSKAHRLHWIHCPEGDLNRLSLKEIQDKGNILVTALREENYLQVGEFVMGAILTFAKNLYHFKEVGHQPPNLWDTKWRDQMMSLQDKVLIQVGMNKAGGEVARRAKQFGMKVWGVQKHHSFHPNCNESYSYKELKKILPQADVVVFNLPRTKEYEGWISREELESIKEGAIVIFLGSPKMVDLDALAELAKAGRYRGVVMDVAYQMPLSQNSPIWGIDNVIITPDVSQRPKAHTSSGIALFRYNLRQYVHGNFKDMRGIVADINELASR